MKKNVVQEKSFEFAVRIVRLLQHLKMYKREFVITKQIIRSGTSKGANIEGAEANELLYNIIHSEK